MSHTRLQRLDRAVQAHLLIHGTPPRTLEEVVKAGLVDRGYLEDAWSRPFHYALTQDGYLLSAVDDAGRPDRTTLIASSHRAYATVEKVVPGDGIGNAGAVFDAAGAAAKRFIVFDMAEVPVPRPS